MTETFHIPEGLPKYTFESSFKIDIPERSEWSCELFGCGQDMVLRPKKGHHPWLIWRWMQYLAFGNKWKRDSCR